MCLDHCVQKLRRRLTQEEAVAGDVRTNGQGEKIGRAPSFYTSRSLMNLSGLSVTDPAPIVSSISLQSAASHGYGNEASQPGFWMDGDYDVVGPDVVTTPAVLDGEPHSRRNSMLADSQDVNEGVMIKSSSMSNFYYKKSMSDDRLNSRNAKRSIALKDAGIEADESS
jgi:hypothetical protein